MPEIFVDNTGALGYDPSTLHTKRKAVVNWTSAGGPFALLFSGGSPFDGESGNAVHVQSIKEGSLWTVSRKIAEEAPFRAYKYKVAVSQKPPATNFAPFIDDCPEVCVEC